MMDVNQLTNEEIRDQLMVHGCDPGPVVESTRGVYANKLRRLLEGESDVTVAPERVMSDTTGAGSRRSSPKRGNVSQSSQKSRSPKRTTRSSTQEISDLSKVQNTSLNSKISHTPSKFVDVSSVNSTIPSFKHSGQKQHVQPSNPIPPKSGVDSEFEIRTESNIVSESHGLPLQANTTSEPVSLDVISSSFKIPKPYPLEAMPKVYHTTPTTRFTSLRDNWENGKISDGSDDDLRGEESSRILLPSWKEDHTYSSRYNSKRMFENSYSGYRSQHNGSVHEEKASQNYGKIGLTLLFIITTFIFVFFVVQNYIELERGEGNNEEF